MSVTKEQVVVEWSINGAPYTQGLEQIERKANSTGAKLDNALKFKGERVVKRQFKGFLGDLSAAQGGMDIASSAAIHFGESLKIGLGTMIGMQLGIKVYEGIEAQIKRAKDAQDAINESFQRGKFTGQSVSVMTQERDRIMEQQKELEKQRSSMLSQLGNNAADLAEGLGGGVLDIIQGKGFKGLKPKHNQELVKGSNEATEEANILNQKIVERMSKQADISELLASGQTKLAREKTLEMQVEEKLALIATDKNTRDGFRLKIAEQQKRINDAETSVLEKQIALEQLAVNRDIEREQTTILINQALERGDNLTASILEADLKRTQAADKINRLNEQGLIDSMKWRQLDDAKNAAYDQAIQKAEKEQRIKSATYLMDQAHKTPQQKLEEKAREREMRHYERLADQKTAQQQVEKQYGKDAWNRMTGEERQRATKAITDKYAPRKSAEQDKDAQYQALEKLFKDKFIYLTKK